MKSWDLVFTGPRQAEFSQQVIDAPKPGEIQCRACLSLVSAGTEERCLNGVFDEGTNWKSWVQYPFKPGYSMLAYVVAWALNRETVFLPTLHTASAST